MTDHAARPNASPPRRVEGGDLRVGLVSLRRFKEHGVIALRIKSGGLKINKIDRFRRDVFAENIEIVAEIEFIQLGGKLLARGT